ncbi:unnamed protein product [Phytophthora fragariaefolia]|uniref:Unnamed protein product n=1 Tax=Phytophthora fragariaefolia TaxID=1490495 RepID=A0A9W7CXI9_9STRA|nr:unnamed protein product [Phytophthora fragariaefolia]
MTISQPPKAMADDRPAADAAAPPGTAPTVHASDPELAPTEPRRPGTISHELNLRGRSVRPLVGLELPVYGSDMKKVLETVNGLPHLQQAHETKSQFLPVKLRPSEPSCKPLFADLTKTQMVLLRLKRSKRRRTAATEEKKEENNDETEAVASDGSRIKAEVVGLVKEKYVCEGMADFQYFTSRSFYPTLKPEKDALTVVANATDAVETAVMNSAVVENGPLSRPSVKQRELQDCLRPYLAVENETQLELIPEVFSKVDLPLKYEFRQRSGYQPTTAVKKPSSTMTYLNFHDDTPAPAGPKPEQPIVRRRSVGVDDNGVDAHVIAALQNKLEQKPVWLRSKLFDGLSAIERRAARRLLRKLCYVFVDGPWRGSWIKMGYDPRQHEVSESASQYQVVELRNNRELVHSKVTHASRKRIKKFVGASSGNANGEGGPVKGPRIVKVTQTSAQENAQANKRRRKERFTRGETRRSYLVEPTLPGSSSSASALVPRASPNSSAPNSGNEWDSEDEQEDKDNEDASGESADNANGASDLQDPGGSSERVFEIFGVQLTSANVLFQLEEIDDDEVREWTAQFTKQTTPSLLGGWYPTQMFLPLREIIRLRIATMVGRSKAELETRRKRLDALKKQALNDYAEELAGGGQPSSGKQKSNGGGSRASGGKKEDAASAEEEEDEKLAFERSLIQERNGASNVENLSAGADAEKAADDEEEEDLEEEEEDGDNENNSGCRSRATFDEDEDEDEDMDDDDDDDEQEQDQAAPDTQQNGPNVSSADAEPEKNPAL